jgi:hypothetical protein
VDDELPRCRVEAAIKDLAAREPDPDYEITRMSESEIREIVQSRFILARQMLWWEEILVRVLDPDAEITKLAGLVEDTINDCCKSIAAVSSIN